MYESYALQGFSPSTNTNGMTQTIAKLYTGSIANTKSNDNTPFNNQKR